MRYKILYLPTAEEVRVPPWVCYDRDEKSLQEVIKTYLAYTSSTDGLFFSLLTSHTHHNQIKIIPTYLLEVVPDV